MGLPIFLLPLSESGAPRCSHHISGFPAFGELIELQAMLLGSVHIVVWARNCGRGVFAALGKGSSLRERGRDGGGQQASKREFSPAYVGSGSWPCENSSARRARRNISEKLRIMRARSCCAHTARYRGWRIVFSTFRRCMSFHTARVKSGNTHYEQSLSALPPIATG